MSKKYKVPFNPFTKDMERYQNSLISCYKKEGEVISHEQYEQLEDKTGWLWGVVDPVFEDPFEFDGQMAVKHHERGRSAAYFIVYNLLDGKEYPMFMTDLVDFLKHTTLVDGQMIQPAKFTQQKRGQNFGIRLIF